MKPIEITDNLFFIERGYLSGNHFVYRSKFPILIDTGYISHFNETERLLSVLGVNLTDVSLIINTHTHCDHIGGNHFIQQQSGCDIALHEVGKYFIDNKDDWSTWWRYYNQDAKFFKCTKTLEDGDIVTIGPHKFQIIYTPGHASDGIVLYNNDEKFIISSDTLWENDMAVMTVRIEGSTALFRMHKSLQKIENLDVKTVYPGHGKPFTDFREAVTRCKARIKKFMDNRAALGNDILKKIVVYTLLMKGSFVENDLFPYLMGTYWFKETVDLYFNSKYEFKYIEIIDKLLDRGAIKREIGNIVTTVKA